MRKQEGGRRDSREQNNGKKREGERKEGNIYEEFHEQSGKIFFIYFKKYFYFLKLTLFTVEERQSRKWSRLALGSPGWVARAASLHASVSTLNSDSTLRPAPRHSQLYFLEENMIR